MNTHSHRSNILIVHPDPIVSAGLVAALRAHGGFEIFVHGVDHLGPDGAQVHVAIADYDNALLLTDPLARRSRGLPEDARILALTPNDREADIRRAIEAGVFGYILPGGPLEELISGLTALGNGLRYLCPSVAHRMAESLTRAALTARETDVLRLVSFGRPNKDIARQLRIELATVKSHMTAIMMKLGARTRTEAARIAATRGLVDGHDGRSAQGLLHAV
jgi:DNA-binding NarL/FixJ family response regulator